MIISCLIFNLEITMILYSLLYKDFFNVILRVYVCSVLPFHHLGLAFLVFTVLNQKLYYSKILESKEFSFWSNFSVLYILSLIYDFVYFRLWNRLFPHIWSPSLALRVSYFIDSFNLQSAESLALNFLNLFIILITMSSNNNNIRW